VRIDIRARQQYVGTHRFALLFSPEEKQMKSIFRFLFVVLCLFTATISLHAQWIQTSAPSGGGVVCFATMGTNLFAGTSGGGAFLSTNNGASWTAVNTGLTYPYVEALAVIGTNLFAGTVSGGNVGGLFISTNSGTSWAKTSLTSTYVFALAVSGTNLFAGTAIGVFLSTDNGTSWTAVNTGLTNTPYNNDTRSLAVCGTSIFAGTNSGVFRSDNNGTSWTAANTGLNTVVSDLAVIGTNLFAAVSGGGVFLATNNGTSWTTVNAGLMYLNVRVLAVSGTNLFAGKGTGAGRGGVFLSTNNGTDWTEVNTGLPDTIKVDALTASGTNLFASTDKGFYRRALSEMVTEVQKISTDLPTQFSLEQNYPNPFNPSTHISYSIPRESKTRLVILDLLGRELRVLQDGVQKAGNYVLTWDGRDERVAMVPSGVYFYRLVADRFLLTKKMILLR